MKKKDRIEHGPKMCSKFSNRPAQNLSSHLPEFTHRLSLCSLLRATVYISARLHDLSDDSDLKHITSHFFELSRVLRVVQYLCNLENLSLFNTPSYMAFSSLTSIPNLFELIDTIIITDLLPVMARVRSMNQSCHLHVLSNVRCTGPNRTTRSSPTTIKFSQNGMN